MQVIIYNRPEGLAIVLPAPDYVAEHGIMAVAKKDVPAGKKFKIVDKDSLPADWSENYAWSFDESTADGVGEKQ